MIKEIETSTHDSDILTFEWEKEDINISTLEYISIIINNPPENITNYFVENTKIIKDLLSWIKSKPKNPKKLKIKYNNEKWILRLEEIATLGYIDKNGTIYYITRKRPDIINSNTPLSQDPWIIFHWGLNKWAINIYRFAGDLNGIQQDNDVQDTMVEETLKSKVFSKDTKIIDLWTFLLANGSNARNKDKKEEDKEPRTSALMNARILLLSKEIFEDIVNQNKNEWNKNYEVVKVEKSETDKTPKHEMFHQLLLKYKQWLKSKTQDAISEIKQRVGININSL